jgi:hypothetical protein
MGVARDVAVVTLRESGKWMEPDKFRELLAREKELENIS